MSVTKEMVSAKAKELGVTLTDEQVNVFVSLDVLPIKEDSDSSTGDDDKKGAQARIRQLVNDKKEAEKKANEANAKLAEREAADAETKRLADLAAGKFKEVADEETKKRLAAETQSALIKKNLQESLVSDKIKAVLLSSGIPQERIIQAVKLFNREVVSFTWKDETAGIFEISIADDKIELFKKDNYFLYPPVDENALYGQRFNPGRVPGSATIGEKEIKELEKKFPAIPR